MAMHFNHAVLTAAAQATSPTKPIYMILLSRYRDQALYTPYLNANISVDSSACTGREAMDRYRAGLRALAGDHAPKPLFMGAVAVNALVGEGEKWDEVVLVKFESLEFFRSTVASEKYKREVEVHRFAGLEDSRLVLVDGVML